LLLVGFQYVDLVIQLKHFRASCRHICFVLAEHATEKQNVVRVESERKVVCQLLRCADLKLGPDRQLSVVSFDCVQEERLASRPFSRHAAKQVNVLRATLARRGVDTWLNQPLVLLVLRRAEKFPLSGLDTECLKAAKQAMLAVVTTDSVNFFEFTIQANSGVLAAHVQVSSRAEATPVVNNETPLGGDRSFTL
jgi:hypothetical protein